MSDYLLNSNIITPLPYTINDKELITSYAFPAATTRLTLGASGTTYTAPANGWFYVTCNPNTNTYGYLSSNNLTSRYVDTGGGPVDATIMLPVIKGDNVIYTYVGGFYSWNGIYFVTAKGDIS